MDENDDQNDAFWSSFFRPNSNIDMSGDNRYDTQSGSDTYTPNTGFSFSGALKTLGNYFGDNTNPIGQLAAFGGLSALLNKAAGSQSQQPVGYQGGIPDYTATRQQTPLAQQRPANYRPGQGGITYFTPVQYTRQPPAPGDSGGLPSLLTPAQFKDYMYQGGADDALATQRGIDYIKQNKLNAQDALSLWNSALGTKFTLDDYNRIMGISPAPSPAPSPSPSPSPAPAPAEAGMTPAKFKQLMYAGGANDATATQRGLDYIKQQGLSAEDALNLWNSALGTKFTKADYDRLIGGTDTGMTPEKFKQMIYAGNADDATATQRGLEYVKSKGMSPEDAVNLWNKSLGTKFTTDDYKRIAGDTSMTPEKFKQYIYSGGADDAEATRRGLDYVQNKGMSPEEAVNLWNKSLGTKFTADDYKRIAGSTSMAPEKFKQYIYQGGADDSTATQRGIDYVKRAGLAPEDALNLWNKSLGTKFNLDDYKRLMGISSDNKKDTGSQKSMTPAELKDYMYAGGANDATATERGLEYVQKMGLEPQAAVNLWNKALGTKFTVDDYNRLTKKTVKPVTDNTVKKADGGYMPGGIAMLAGGRYLRGPGDGVSDSIPAKFERSGQPARLADGEFVIDARTVSEIGNGSSEAGARKLYAMMDRVHAARKKAQRGKPSGADKFLPK